MSESQEKYPRVLVVAGYGFNQTSGGGITLTNLFEGWPADRLAIIHADVNGNTPGVAKYEFTAGRKCVIPGTLIGVRWRTHEEIAKSEAQSVQAPNAVGGRRGYCWVRTVANTLLKWTGLVGLVERYSVSQETIDILTSFGPEIIYIHPGSISFARLSIDIKKKLDAPLVVHIMDDFPNSLYTKGLLSKLVSGIMETLMRRLFAEASICLGISAAMCSEYNNRYGLPFYCFHNPVNPGFFNGDAERTVIPLDNKRGFRLVYAGRVGWGVAEGLKDVSEAVKSLEKDNIKLAIFANDSESLKDKYDYLKHLPPNVTMSEAPKSVIDIAAVLQSADALVLPVEFEIDAVRAIRLSMPTKVPAYLSSGAPILIYGPEEVGFVNEAIGERWAYVVRERSIGALTDAIKHLSENGDLRANLVEKALKKAESFESTAVRQAFAAVLLKVVRGRMVCNPQV